MKLRPRLALPFSLLAAAVLLSPAGSPADEASKIVAAEMADAADNFLDALDETQRAKATFALEADERGNWHYIPKQRNGLPLKEMRDDQRALAHALLSSGMSHAGFAKATTIMSLERMLWEIENHAPHRDAAMYHVSIFGEPGADAWGWRFEGHHLSLNFTVVKGEYISATPSFYGANPGEAKTGEGDILRVLGDEEDLGRELVKSLDDAQKAAAILPGDAPADVLTKADRKVKPLGGEGIGFAKLNAAQQKALQKLIDEYFYRHRPAIAGAELAKIKAAGTDQVVFAWMGGTEPGQGHYYRVQGPTFLIEFDNTQNGAKHPHAVIRSFEGDFGEDVLAKHLSQAHGK